MELTLREDHAAEIRRLLLGSSAQELSEQTNDQDLLQQAIILNNTDAALYCLVQKVYPETHQPVCNDYLHLACKLGREHIVKIFMEVDNIKITR